MAAQLSIIIPTLNAATQLPETANALLEGISTGLIKELIISDGGSSDETEMIAKELGAIFISGKKSRGGQIARGVAAAKGDWLLILHADTHLSPDWMGAAQVHMTHHGQDAGWFRLRFRAEGIMAKLVAGGANIRSKRLGLPYGDQGLLVARAVLERVGSVPELPLMEDVELACRLKGRLRRLEAYADTSAEKYFSEGWIRRVARNLCTLAKYARGRDPEQLAAGYDNNSKS
ncbi:MAG: glycosyltransferase [Boseongicola sp.]|nr:MAG: glycosyltransferase [Boseongicola sp.]